MKIEIIPIMVLVGMAVIVVLWWYAAISGRREQNKRDKERHLRVIKK